MGAISRKWAWALIICLIATGWAEWTASADTSAPKTTSRTLAEYYPTPEALAAYLEQALTFEEDTDLFGQVDYWQSPKEFLARGKGDCEDYALLAYTVLKRQGVEAFPFSLYGPNGFAHTVCVFVEDGRYNVINQDKVLRYEADSLEMLADLLCPTWSWGAVAERSGHRGRAVRVIQKTA